MTAPVKLGSNIWDGRTVGLLGGSFNPAHRAHRYIAEEALKRLSLDFVWLMVSPGNPLKSDADMNDLESRMASADKIATHPRIMVTDIEKTIGTNHTFDTVKKLQKYFPRTHFVWLMGADNMQQFSMWFRWNDIVCTLPIAIFDRPEYSIARVASSLAGKYRKFQVAPTVIRKASAPAWTFVTAKRDPVSATSIRKTIGNIQPNNDRKT